MEDPQIVSQVNNKKRKMMLIAGTVLLLLAFTVAFYIYSSKTNSQNNLENSQTPTAQEQTMDAEFFQPDQQSQQNKKVPMVEIGGETITSGGLSVCLDKCGDGTCQAQETICEGGNLNCVCIETPAECPQDCKVK